jgi:uncharacterized membrane protein HdeD (DUF308 family)
MNDDVFCLFVIVAGVVTLAVPTVAQTMLAVFTGVLVVAGYLSVGDKAGVKQRGSSRHGVAG